MDAEELKRILALPDIERRIDLIKKARRTDQPKTDQNKNDWFPERHDVMNPEIRKNETRVIEPEVRDQRTGRVTSIAKTEEDPVNRIALPLEQDIVNIHTAFTVGTPPRLYCETDDKKQQELFKIVNAVDRKNKIKYHNKRIVRSWLSEQEVAEYWYTVEDKGYWKRILSKVKAAIGINTKGERKIKCAIWSPFRGDTLWPVFSDSNDYLGLGREYKVKQSNGSCWVYFQFVTDTSVELWVQNGSTGWTNAPKHPFSHNFKKNPTIYSYRPETLCAKIRPIRNRTETILSNYADCIDYNFAPKLVATGKITGNQPKGARGGLVELGSGGDLKYLSWQQTPDAAKLEIDTLTERAYSLTNTPRISFENLQGLGNAFSGVSFQYAFMGAHMAVEMHAETIGEFLQRRYNFLVSAIGSVNTAYDQASEEIDIEVEVVPYMIGNKAEDIKMAVDAYQGGIASLKEGVILAGLMDDDKIDEEVAAIEAQESKRREEILFPIGAEE